MNTDIFLTKIKNTKSTAIASLCKSIRKDQNFLNYVMQSTSFIIGEVDLAFRLYHIRNGLTSQIHCKYCNTPLLKLRTMFCNKSCSALYLSKDEELKFIKSKSISRTYNMKTEYEKNKIKEKRRNTNLIRYGVSCNLYINGMQDRIINGWILKYGVNRPSKNLNIKYHQYIIGKANSKISVSKTKNTSYIKYGVSNYSKTDECKRKVESTFLLKYGTTHPMKNKNYLLNYLETSHLKFKSKVFILPSGKTVKLLGYEPIVLEWLLSKYDESDILIGYDCFKYLKPHYIDDSGNTHVYIPDFIILSKNLVIDVKSNYTYSIANKNKRECIKTLNYNFVYIIYDLKSKKIKIKRYE